MKLKLLSLILSVIVISSISSITLVNAVEDNCNQKRLPQPKEIWSVICDLQHQVTSLTTALNTEKTARQTGDANLQTQINNIQNTPNSVYCPSITFIKQVTVELLQLHNFRGCDYSGLSFPFGVSLSGSDFGGANLSGSYLVNSLNQYTNFRGANLSGANFNGATFAYSDLSGTNLDGTDFTGTTLTGLVTTGCHGTPIGIPAQGILPVCSVSTLQSALNVNSLTGTRVRFGSTPVIIGSNFAANSLITLKIDGVALTSFPIDSSGMFRTTITITSSFAIGVHSVSATDSKNNIAAVTFFVAPPNEIDIALGAGDSANNHPCSDIGYCFIPNPLNVNPGTIVTWNNTDAVSHTVTSGLPGDSNAGSLFDSGLIKPNGIFQFTFPQGQFNYHCSVHPWMTGQVIAIPIPPSVYLIDVKATTISISWTNANPLVDQFGIALSDGTSHLFSSSTHSYTITGLITGKQYSITLGEHDNSGWTIGNTIVSTPN